MLETLMLSITSFIGTNVDDMIITTFFFSLAEGKKEIRSIVLGRYFGAGVLILISMIGSLGLKWIPLGYVKYLGFVPIGLGVKAFFDNDTEKNEENRCMGDSKTSSLLWNAAIVTIANGSDNVGVYIPLFTRFSVNPYMLFLFVFVFMSAIWCAIGYKASKVSFYEKMIHKYKKVVVPLVYISLGVYILV